MGINQHQPSSRDLLLNYVPLLGGLYVVNERNLGLIKQAREVAGATQVDTYQGSKGDSVSAKAIGFLRDHELFPVSLSGKLTGVASTIVNLASGDKLNKLLVQISDGEENFVLSLDMSNSGTQKLIRKLENVAPGSDVAINLFGAYERNENRPDDPKFYTNHGATLKVGGQEIQGKPERIEEIKAKVQEVKDNLKKVNITDKTVTGNAIKAASVEYYTNLVNSFAFKAPNPENIPARATDPAVSDLTGGADGVDLEHEFDVPSPPAAPTRTRGASIPTM